MIKPSTVSTAQLKTSLPLHSRPINLVVFQGSLVLKRTTKPHLEGGFPLRCFQRLSLPNVATLRWPKRANRITRGWSNLVLSY